MDMDIETQQHPEIDKFIKSLVSCELLMNFGEGIILAKITNRYRPDYGVMTDTVATRAAHKKYGPAEQR